MKTKTKWAALASVAIITAASTAWAATTLVVRDDTFQTLKDGEFEGVALSSDGYLYPSYGRSQSADTGTEIVWSAVDAGKGRVIAATGHDGKLVAIEEGEEPEVIAEFEEPELTALARTADGDLFIAAAPTGRIYRLADDDQLTTFAQLEAKFIWDMEFDQKGNLWAVTGADGKLFKISTDGDEAKVELACDTESQNLIDLWIDAEGMMGDAGRIYLAGQSPGWLYSFKDGDDEAEIIYNAGADEIRALQPTAKGLVLATNTERAPSAQVLSLTLRMSGAVSSGSTSSSGGSGSSSTSQSAAERDFGDVFSSGKRERPATAASTLVRLTADGFAEPIWTAPERPIHSLAASANGDLIVAAGNKGRLFEVMDRGRFALIADFKEDYLVSVSAREGGWLVTAARNGLVIGLDSDRAKEAVYRSRVIDAKTPVRWGGFYWRGEAARGQKINVSFRKGSTEDPEKGGWSDWSKEQNAANGERVTIPDDAARYMQYRLTLEQGRRAEPVLRADYVEAFYQQANRAPEIRRIAVSAGAATRASSTSSSSSSSSRSSSARPASSSSSSSRSSSSSATPAATPAQGGGRDAHSNTRNINVTWQANDPNGDKLVYSLYFRAEDETEWKLIDDEIRTSRVPLGVSGVGDGRYRFRVDASDEFTNPPGQGLDATLTSDEIVIDNTPPRIEGLRVRPVGDTARVTFRAEDDLSLISTIEVDLDGEDTYPIFPNDGFLDQQREEIEWTTLKLEPGEHVVTIAVTDRRGNTTVERSVFQIEP